MALITSTKTLGQLVKASRKASGMTQVEAAGACGVGVRFLSELENGKASVQFDSVLAVLSGLGLDLRATKAEDDVVELSRDVIAEQATLDRMLSESGDVNLALQIRDPEAPKHWAVYHKAKKRVKQIEKNKQAAPLQKTVVGSKPSNQPLQKTAVPKRSLIGL